MTVWQDGKEGKLRAYTMKRVAAGAHFQTLWLFEPAKRPDERADSALNVESVAKCCKMWQFVAKRGRL